MKMSGLKWLSKDKNTYENNIQEFDASISKNFNENSACKKEEEQCGFDDLSEANGKEAIYQWNFNLI